MNFFTLSNTVTLNITIIVFACPDKSSLRFHHMSDHIINQSMLIPDFFILKLLPVLFFINLLENVFEFSIVFFQNRILSSQVQRILSIQIILKAAVGELNNAFISIIHSHSNSSLSLILVDLHCSLFTVFALE